MRNKIINLYPKWKYLDLLPYQAGYEKNGPNSSFGPCARNHYLFHYVLTGAGTFAADAENDKDWRRITLTRDL